MHYKKYICQFDALVQVLSCGYVNNITFREAITSSNNSLLKTAVALAICGAVPKTYKLRATAIAEVLDPTSVAPSFKTKTRSNKKSTIVIAQYDCFGNASQLAEELLKNSHSVMHSLTCTAPQCAQDVVDVNMNQIFQHGLNTLQQVIHVSIEDFSWRK